MHNMRRTYLQWMELPIKSVRFRFNRPTLFLLIPAFFFGCEDLLPEYHPPENVFKTAIVGFDPVSDTIEFTTALTGDGTVATYQTLYLLCTVTNIYEETFHNEIEPQGTIEILISEERSLNTISTISIEHLVPTVQYHSSTKMLTLDPQRFVYFKVEIRPKLSSGFYLHKYAKEKSTVFFFKDHYALKIFEPMKLKVKSTIQLSKNLPAVSDERVFTVILKGKFGF